MTPEEYARLASFVVGWQTSESEAEARTRCGVWASAEAAALRRKGVPLRHFRPPRHEQACPRKPSPAPPPFQWDPSYRKLADLARECRPS